MPLDERHIDPDPDLLAHTLLRAMRSANGRLEERRLSKPLAFWQTFVRRARKKPEGWQRWVGGRGGMPAPLVKVGWWTDPVGRKHWRIQGRRSLRWHDDERSAFHAYPLWHVYPDRLMLRERQGCQDLLAVCSCGVAGPVQAIAWMGQQCGPCHDRLEEELSVPSAPDWPRVLRGGHRAQVNCAAFTGDGRLLTGCYGGRIVSWDLDTGAAAVLLRVRDRAVSYLAVSVMGTVAAALGGDRLMLRAPGEDWRQLALPRRVYVRGLAYSPDGCWLAVPGSPSFLVDLRKAEPTVVGVLDGEASGAAVLGPDGTSYWMMSTTGELVRLGPGGAGRTVLGTPLQGAFHIDYWENHSPGPYYSDPFVLLTCSPDGRRLALVTGWEGCEGIRLCDLGSGTWSTLDPIVSSIQAMRFTPDGLLASAGTRGSVRLWDLAGGGMRGLLLTTPAKPMHSFPFLSADGGTVAFGSEGWNVHVVPWRSILEG
jgi:hypothetical protein